MNEERKMILDMLQEGSISAEEAEKLLDSIPENKELSIARTHAIEPKRLLIIVTENDKTIVNARIPFGLIKAGLKLGKASMALGAKYAGDIDGKEILEMLKDVDLDEVIDCLNSGEITLPYTLIDVDAKETNNNNGEVSQHVEIILE